MSELSVFVDESGDFGEYSSHSPYYIITMIFHNQDKNIQPLIEKLEYELSNAGFNDQCIHVGPIIRKEESFTYMNIEERKSIFNKMFAFIRSSDIQYKCFMIEKLHIEDEVEATGKLSKQIANFIKTHYQDFLDFDTVKVYYDNGQVQVTKILSSVFNTLLDHVQFRKVSPSDYRLFQAADLICSFKLLEMKFSSKSFSKSEMLFFNNYREFKKNYLKILKVKEYK